MKFTLIALTLLISEAALARSLKGRMVRHQEAKAETSRTPASTECQSEEQVYEEILNASTESPRAFRKRSR